MIQDILIMGKPLVLTYLPLLKALTSIKDKKLQRRLLRALCKEKKFKNCVCELAHNTIKQNILLSEQDKRRLNKHSSLIRGLSKKKKLQQAGGFLNIVVPLLAAQLGQLIFSSIKQ